MIDPLKKDNLTFEPLDISRLVYSLAIAAVIYPTIYKQAKFHRKPNIMQLFVAFQSGFFWDTVMHKLG
jgi:hypothetical protein